MANFYRISLAKVDDVTGEERTSFSFLDGEVTVSSTDADITIPVAAYDVAPFRAYVRKVRAVEVDLTSYEGLPKDCRIHFNQAGNLVWSFKANEVGEAAGQVWSSKTIFDASTQMVTIEKRKQGCLSWADFLAFVSAAERFINRIKMVS